MFIQVLSQYTIQNKWPAPAAHYKPTDPKRWRGDHGPLSPEAAIPTLLLLTKTLGFMSFGLGLARVYIVGIAAFGNSGPKPAMSDIAWRHNVLLLFVSFNFVISLAKS
jgi:hypothetical protein